MCSTLSRQTNVAMRCQRSDNPRLVVKVVCLATLAQVLAEPNSTRVIVVGACAPIHECIGEVADAIHGDIGAHAKRGGDGHQPAGRNPTMRAATLKV